MDSNYMGKADPTVDEKTLVKWVAGVSYSAACAITGRHEQQFLKGLHTRYDPAGEYSDTVKVDAKAARKALGSLYLHEGTLSLEDIRGLLTRLKGVAVHKHYAEGEDMFPDEDTKFSGAQPYYPYDALLRSMDLHPGVWKQMIDNRSVDITPGIKK